MERAYDDAKYGRFSSKPYIDIIIPTLVDPSMAPPGKHIMSCFVQYAPYDLDPSLGGWDNQREAFGDAVVEADRRVRAGPALEDPRTATSRPRSTSSATTGLTEGNIFQGELSLEQLFFSRPVPGWARFRTPVRTSGCAAPRPIRAAGSWARTAGSRPWRCSRDRSSDAGLRGAAGRRPMTARDRERLRPSTRSSSAAATTRS